MMIYVLLALYGISFGALIFASYNKKQYKYRLPAKTVTSLLFVLIASYCGFVSGNLRFCIAMQPAFFFCMAGDVLLDIADIKGDKKYFIGGLSAFLLGHVLFSATLSMLSKFTVYDLIIPIISVAVTAILIKIADLQVGTLKIPVLVYSFFVAMLLSKGLSVFLKSQTTTSVFILIGAALFFISDAIILFLLFHKIKKSPTLFFNLFTYYMAQMFLALSILYSN